MSTKDMKEMLCFGFEFFFKCSCRCRTTFTQDVGILQRLASMIHGWANNTFPLLRFINKL